MHRLATLALASSLTLVITAASAAPQPRDYFLDPPRGGTYVHADLVTVGAQVSLERRQHLEEDMSMAQLRVSGLYSLGYAEAAAHADIRVLLFQIGGSLGMRRVNKTYTGAGNVSIDARREKDKGTADKSSFKYGEARARLIVPLSPLWLVANAAMRWEDGQDPESYDWFHTNVHDAGKLLRLDATLFFRNPSFGGIGPTIRYMDMPRATTSTGRITEVVYGLTFGTRPGFKRRDDILLVQVLMKPGDSEFGFHILKNPIWTMLVYRASFEL